MGTVDQAMMAALAVKHAHLRGAVLSRSLLIIDEVHASDSWMTRIQQELVASHCALGGHALLMSATLGSAARSGWRGQELPLFDQAARDPYPAVWTRAACHPVNADTREKRVHVQALDRWGGPDAARIAVQAAGQGARVLVIRNTVDRARETWRACIDAAADLVFALNGMPTGHHSRFAAEDRALLDRRVEEVLGKTSAGQGVIVIGTQTLEQSLDIDADLLVTDLAPMDVLLQRIGRLHRHDRPRPAGFEAPHVVVLTPPQGLGPLTQVPVNGLGAVARAASLSGVYTDVPGLAATLQAIHDDPLRIIPEMNRALVEAATQPERLATIAAENGWDGYWRRMTGAALAKTEGAELVILDRAVPFPKSFPSDEAIRTRLGEEGVILTLLESAFVPFGQPVRRFALPVHWSRGMTGNKAIAASGKGSLTITAGEWGFRYGADGLLREESD